MRATGWKKYGRGLCTEVVRFFLIYDGFVTVILSSKAQTGDGNDGCYDMIISINDDDGLTGRSLCGSLWESFGRFGWHNRENELLTL